MEEETRYPIRFEKCPVCGGSECIVQEETNNEIKAGRLKEDAMIPVLVTQSKIFDPQSGATILAERQIPVLLGFYDVCANCGTLYCREIQKQFATTKPRTKNDHRGYNIWKN